MTLLARFRRSRARLTCQEVGELLQGYLDGELDDGWAERVAAHLEDCRRCGLEAETYDALRASLGQRRAVEPERLARLRAFADDLARGDGP